MYACKYIYMNMYKHTLNYVHAYMDTCPLTSGESCCRCKMNAGTVNTFQTNVFIIFSGNCLRARAL